MRMKLIATAIVLSVAAAPQAAVDQQASSRLGAGRAMNQAYNSIKTSLIESAAKMSEADFAFKPTPEVRTFGQLIGHVTNTGYASCAALLGEPNPNKQNFETESGKVPLSAALGEMVKYCDKAFASLTDENAAESIKVGQREMARIVPAANLIAHLNEHYGNLVTYMRIKGIVPPSTERAMKR